MEKSKIKTSFEMSLDNGWVMNFIENDNGTKTIELGTKDCYPIEVTFGVEDDTRWIEIFDNLRDPEMPANFISWR